MTCPIHKVEFKVVPAGVSKKTGRPYNAFEVCPVEGCRERPQAPLAQDGLDGKILEQKESEAIKRVEERSYRIERQHSQEMAIRTMDLWTKLQIAENTDITKEQLLESITKLTDHFMEDLEE